MCVAHSCYMFRSIYWPSSGVTSLVERYSACGITKNTVSIWNLGAVRNLLEDGGKRKKVCRVGRLQDLPFAYFQLGSSLAKKVWESSNCSLKSELQIYW